MRSDCTTPLAGGSAIFGIDRGATMSAADWVILVLVLLAIVAVGFLVLRRRRRAGGVIATKDKR